MKNNRTIETILDEMLFQHEKGDDLFCFLLDNPKDQNKFKGIEHVEKCKDVVDSQNRKNSFHKDIYKVIDENQFKESIQKNLSIHYVAVNLIHLDESVFLSGINYTVFVELNSLNHITTDLH